MDSITKRNGVDEQGESIVSEVLFKYLPYWPLFLIVACVSLAGGYIYMRYAVPVYQISANILLKDDKKGSNDSKILESLDMFGGQKNVENEIEVLHSKPLVKKVVRNLNLYAPLFEQGTINTVSAYTLSPVTVEAKNPDSLTDASKLFYTPNIPDYSVTFNNKRYFVGQWFVYKNDSLRFLLNPHYKEGSLKKPLFFQLTSVKKVSKNLIEKIKIEALSKQASIIKLSLQDEVSVRGEDILNELISVYNKASIEDKNLLAANTLAFIERRLNYVVNELDSVERAVQNYKTTRGIVDISEQGRIFLQNVGAADQKVSEINMQLAVLDQVEKYVLAKESPGIVPSTLGVNDPVLSQLLERLYDLEIQYDKLRKTTGENNPVLTSLQEQINRIKPSLLENIGNQRKSLTAGKGNLEATSSKYSSILNTIPQKERGLLDVSRQQAIKNNIYTFLLQKREETALSFASTVADSRTIDEAEASIFPVWPLRLWVYSIALIIGLIVSAAIVAARELLNNKILFRKEIERYVSWPVIGEISYDKGKTSILTNASRSVISEQFRQIRTSLTFLGINEKKKKVLVTSSISGEGKSYIAINLAVSLSLTNKRVVLMEFDLRKPKLATILKADRKVGISTFLIGRAEAIEIIKKTEVNENLFFISSGPIPPNPSELIMSERMPELIEYLEKNFDYIIIDSAPVAPVTDANILSKHCDATVFVVRHDFTPKAFIKTLEENNKVRGLKNVAIIFNGLKERGFGNYGYGYGYGYGYSYGYGYEHDDTEESQKENRVLS